MLFDHGIDVARLQEAAQRVPFVLLSRHEQQGIGGNDPSELLVVAVRGFWESACLHSVVRGQFMRSLTQPSEDLIRTAERTWPAATAGCLRPWKTCGAFAPLLIHTASLLGFDVFYFNAPLQMRLHRLNGQWHLGVMRPQFVGSAFRSGRQLGVSKWPGHFKISNDAFRSVMFRSGPQLSVAGVLDITRSVVCAIGQASACHSPSRGEIKPAARCWGVTNRAHASAWLCQRDAALVDDRCEKK